MKKTAAGAAVAAAMGLSILSASPALAEVGPFANCDEANAAGYGFIRVGEPGYAPHLDPDGDGMACPFIISPGPGPHVDESYIARENNQIVQVPVGAPDTGAAMEPTAFDASFLLATAGAAVITLGAFAAARRKAGAPVGSR